MEIALLHVLSTRSSVSLPLLSKKMLQASNSTL